jgi:hypothetical protein
LCDACLLSFALRTFASMKLLQYSFAALFLSSGLLLSACKEDEESPLPNYAGRTSVLEGRLAYDSTTTDIGVKLTHKATNEVFTTSTQGAFRFTNLPLGDYLVSFSSANPGFIAPADRTVTTVKDQTSKLGSIYVHNTLLRTGGSVGFKLVAEQLDATTVTYSVGDAFKVSGDTVLSLRGLNLAGSSSRGSLVLNIADEPFIFRKSKDYSVTLDESKVSGRFYLSGADNVWAIKSATLTLDSIVNREIFGRFRCTGQNADALPVTITDGTFANLKF